MLIKLEFNSVLELCLIGFSVAPVISTTGPGVTVAVEEEKSNGNEVKYKSVFTFW